MARLKSGDSIKSSTGEDILIKDELGEGGQGTVYKVLYKGKECALKWYSRGVNDMDRFYKNIEDNIQRGKPTPTFLWPLAITEIIAGKNGKTSFGYVMDLRPAAYKDFDDFLLKRVSFKSYSAIVNAALQITASFRKLHQMGLSYQDLNDGNFFINPDNGSVLICDNDNIAPDGFNLEILGKPGYMAPEIISGKKRPDTFSDRFSLAVVLFLLFFRAHPLEGMKDSDLVDPDQNERNLYCEDPVFIFDPSDKSNRPNPDRHQNALLFWPRYPKHIQDLFIRAFSKERMQSDGSSKREDRVTEREWLEGLLQLRSEIIRCPSCKEDTFFDKEKESCLCENCGKSIRRPPVFKIRKQAVILQVGASICQWHVDDSVAISMQSISKEVGKVESKPGDPKVIGLRNKSGKAWVMRTPQGKEQVCKNGSVIPVVRGITIKFGSCEGTIY